MPLCKRFERELVPEWRLHCVDYKVNCCGLRLAPRSSLNLIAQHVTASEGREPALRRRKPSDV